jgi:hypothetical protein
MDGDCRGITSSNITNSAFWHAEMPHAKYHNTNQEAAAAVCMPGPHFCTAVVPVMQLSQLPLLSGSGYGWSMLAEQW